ncbi:unnamed protein product [Onchocerca ochengi]|uniref:ATP-dependent DNA helicase n=1 Tax=Onchocerca ochengi TaxID=42157 RepID=A0A182E3H8_ONCOC|nr:unnamed protein product [Onchocerca ochengi]
MSDDLPVKNSRAITEVMSWIETVGTGQNVERCWIRCKIDKVQMFHASPQFDFEDALSIDNSAGATAVIEKKEKDSHERKSQVNFEDSSVVAGATIHAPGKTDKTFLIKLILAAIRSQNGIALALALSEIFATFLSGRKIAHSALKLPLNMQFIETPTCSIFKASGMGKVFWKCEFIVRSECTMMQKKFLEALDRSLQVLRGNIRPNGNALILLAEDFRQTIPLIS